MAVIMSQATRTIDKIAEYALNDKEGQKGDRYVVSTGVGCHPTTFKQQSRADRRRAKKSKGYVEGYALVQSFAKYELDPTKPEDWERANELGVAIGKAVAGGRPFIVVTQLDGKSGCLHNHIVISSVHPVTGRSFDSSAVTHGVLARTHDKVLAANGFVQTTELKAHRQLHDSTKKIAMRAAGQYVWTDDLTARVKSALADERAVDETSFLAILGEHGVDVGPNPDRSKKDWTFGMADAEKVNEAGEPVYRKSRGSRLAAHLTKPAIRQQLAQKQRQVAADQQQVEIKPVSAPAPTEQTQEPALITTEELYRLVMGEDLDGLAPTDKEKPYVSRLRQLRFKKPDPKRQQLINGLASFDEETRARLAEGLRPIEAHVPKGVGRRVLGSLGSHLDPAVRAQLELRETKKRARSMAFEAGRDLTKELDGLRADGKQHSEEFDQTEVKRNVADHRRARLERELAAGCYEDVAEALATWKAAHPEVAKLSAADREAYVQRGQVALDEALEQAQHDRQVGD